MKIGCILCGYEMNLDHQVFNNYDGPVKCFSCGTIMGIRTSQGILDSIDSSDVLSYSTTGGSVEPLG